MPDTTFTPTTVQQTLTGSLVAAVRDHKIVGRNTCSPIDECMTDDELIETFVRLGITTRRRAIAWAVMTHNIDADRWAAAQGDY